MHTYCSCGFSFIDTNETVAGDQQMVEQVDSEQFAGIRQLPGDGDIFFGRLQAAGRMVVRDNDRHGAVFDSRTEYLTRVDDVGGQATDGNDLVVYYFIAAVQIKSDRKSVV